MNYKISIQRCCYVYISIIIYVPVENHKLYYFIICPYTRWYFQCIVILVQMKIIATAAGTSRRHRGTNKFEKPESCTVSPLYVARLSLFTRLSVEWSYLCCIQIKIGPCKNLSAILRRLLHSE